MTRVPVLVAMTAVLTSAALFWRRGQVEWWGEGEPLALGALLPADRALVARAEELLETQT